MDVAKKEIIAVKFLVILRILVVSNNKNNRHVALYVPLLKRNNLKDVANDFIYISELII